MRASISAIIGVATTFVGSALLYAASATPSWDRVHAIVYFTMAIGCFATALTTRAGWFAASEVLLLLTGFAGILGVIVAGSLNTAMLAGLAGLNVLVLTPGVAIRERGGLGRIILLLSSATYVLSVLTRIAIRDDDPPMSVGELGILVFVPLTGFALVWLMARARDRR